MNSVKVGKVYRHFKGNYYYVVDIAKDSETKENVVVYKPLYERTDSMLWVRSEKMFLEAVDINRPDNITKQTIRFELMEDLSKNYIG